MFTSCCYCPSKKVSKGKSASAQPNDAEVKAPLKPEVTFKEDTKMKNNNYEAMRRSDGEDTSAAERPAAVAEPRRKSVGILKSTTSYNERPHEEHLQKRASISPSVKIDCYVDECQYDDDVFGDATPAPARGETGSPHPAKRGFFEAPRLSLDEGDEGDEAEGGAAGAAEPPATPATPVGRDEIALRRHRFFAELIRAAQADADHHKVHFDPLGPEIATLVNSACDPEAAASLQGPAAELESLVSRLERVTCRLERTLTAGILAATLPPAPPPAPPPPLHAVLDLIADSSALPLPVQEKSDGNSRTMSVAGFQDILAGPLKTYLSISQQIGGEVANHANLVNNAFQAQLRFLQTVASAGKPSQNDQMSLLTPTSQQIQAIQEFREKNRASQFFNHLSAISESIPALGWVTVSPAPSPYVKEMNDAGQFYTNRVLKEWKERNARHVEWCRAWVQTLQELQAYVKQHHTTGLVWSGSGGIPPPPPACGMPPPPPCLPDFDLANAGEGDDRNALFAQINQGADITKSLKKVTSEMQTHKNPTLRSGPAPFKAPAGAANFNKPIPQPGSGVVDKPPVFNRDGKKWLIEYQRGNQALTVENADMNNVVYMFRCRDSALTIKGKLNSVVLDSCTKCAVVFDSLVSSVEFVNCQSVQMQVLGKVPTITIDKTDGCQMYLSPDSLNVEIVSSKSSEMNVLLPKGNGDYTEHPIPEQFKTTLSKTPSGLTTVAIESSG